MKEAQDNIESFDDFIRRIIKLTESYQKELSETVKDEVLSLENIRGKLSINRGTSAAVNEIIRRINEAIKKGGYPTQLSRLLRQVDDVETTSIKLVEALNDRSFNYGVREERDLIIDDIVDRVASFESFKVNITDEVRRIIVKSILQQSTIKDLTKELDGALLTKDGQDGILSKYVSQVTTDAVSQYRGTVNQRIMDRFDLDGITYIGSIIETSRPQCRRWADDLNGKIFIKKPSLEVDFKYGLLNDEVKYVHDNINNTEKVNGYGKPGKSYYIDLTADNFMVFRGGYNCRHEAIPYKVTQKALRRSEQLRKQYDEQLQKISELKKKAA